MNARICERLGDWSLLLLCNLIWASQFVLVKVVEGQVGPLAAVSIPIAAATVLLAAIVPRTALRGMLTSDWRRFSLLGLAGQLAAQVGATWGAQLTLAGNAALLNLALPVVTAFFAFLLLGERMTALRWTGLALALAGALAGAGIDWASLTLAQPQYAWGNSLVLLGVTGSSFYNTYSKKVLARYGELEVLLASYVVLLGALVPVTIVAEPHSIASMPDYTLKVWIALILLAVFQYGLSMVMFLRVLSHLDATKAGISNYFIPVFGVALGALVLGERLSTVMIVSGCIVLGGTLLATVAET
jgi:drug/metabolite transporter (DMT)-like permease